MTHLRQLLVYTWFVQKTLLRELAFSAVLGFLILFVVCAGACFGSSQLELRPRVGLIVEGDALPESVRDVLERGLGLTTDDPNAATLIRIPSEPTREAWHVRTDDAEVAEILAVVIPLAQEHLRQLSSLTEEERARLFPGPTMEVLRSAADKNQRILLALVWFMLTSAGFSLGTTAVDRRGGELRLIRMALADGWLWGIEFMVRALPLVLLYGLLAVAFLFIVSATVSAAAMLGVWMLASSLTGYAVGAGIGAGDHRIHIPLAMLVHLLVPGAALLVASVDAAWIPLLAVVPLYGSVCFALGWSTWALGFQLLWLVVLAPWSVRRFATVQG